MKSKLEDIAIIDRYLNGEFTGAEEISVEQRLQTDPKFLKLMDEVRLMRDGIILAEKKSLLAKLDKLEKKSKAGPSASKGPTDRNLRIVFSKVGHRGKVRTLIGTIAVALLLLIVYRNYWGATGRIAPQLVNEYFELFEVIGINRDESGAITQMKTSAFDLYEKRKFEQAIPLFSTLYVKYRDTLSLFYLGIAQIGANRPADAVESLEVLQRSDQYFSDQINWYLALAYIQSGAIGEAKTILLSLQRTSDDYRDKSSRLLQELQNLTSTPVSDHSDQQLMGFIHWPTFKPDAFLAEKKQQAGDFLQAIRSFSKLLKDSLQLNQQDRIYIFNQLAYSFARIGEVDSLETYLKKVEKDIGRLEEMASPNLADYYFNLGLYQKQNDGQSALEYFLKSCTLYQSTYGINHLKYIQALTESGLAYLLYSSRVDSGLYLLEEAHRLVHKNPSLSPFTWQVYYGKANVSLIRRDFVTGLANINEALARVKQLRFQDTIAIARCHSLKGNLLKKVKNFSSARTEFETAIQLLEQRQEPDLIVQEFYRDLIINYRAEGDSVNFFSHLALFKEKFKPQEYEYAFPKRLEANYYYWQKDYRSAIDGYQLFLKDHLQRKIPSRFLLDEAYYILPIAYEAVAQFDSAMLYTIRNITYETSMKDRQIPWDTLISSPQLLGKPYNFVSYGQLAVILTKKYEADTSDVNSLHKAFQLYRLIDSLLLNKMGVSEEDAVLRFLKEVGGKVFPGAIRTSFYLYQKTGESAYLDWLNNFIERTKSTVLYKDMLANNLKNYPEVPDSLRQMELKIKEEINEIKFQTHDYSASESSRELKLLADLQALHRTYRKLYPRYYEARFNQLIPPIATIQEKLTTENLVQYHIGEHDIFILSISKKEKKLYRIARPVDLDATLAKFAEILKTGLKYSEKEEYYQVANQLYHYFVAPFFDEINSRTLVIIPDGSLNSIPFGALLTKAVERSDYGKFRRLPYLFKEVELVYAHSLKNYLYKKDNNRMIPSKPKILAYSYSGKKKETKSPLAELPGAFEELNVIKRLFPSNQNEFLFGEKGTKAHFTNVAGKNIDILHLGTHAASSGTDKLDNRIYFRHQYGKSNLDTLYGFEIAPLQLRATLVVLSACETAYGTNVEREGTYSLTRSLVQAGVPNIVSTLWKVDDRVTAKIISAFYRELKNNQMDYLYALRSAKLDYLTNASSEILAHPSYWAGVICY